MDPRRFRNSTLGRRIAMANPILNLKRSMPLAGGIAGLLCLLATVPAGAAIVTIDLTSAGTGGIDITGVNAGMTWEGPKTVVAGFVPGGDLDVFCGYSSTAGSSLRQLGLDGDGNLRFAHIDGSLASPLKYTTGQTVDGTADYSSSDSETMFYYTSSVDGPAHSANFGPNSFMGFRFGNSTDGYRYGYIEVLWNWTGDRATSTFQLLSAAYESQVNTGIVIPSPVVVPGTGLAGLAAIGLAGVSRRRRR
jgi:hypothetical protein